MNLYIFFYLNKIRYLNKINFVSYYALTATNESLHTEIREVMHTMDKLRNKLYEDFRPQIKMLEELQINDGIMENVHPLVATKKVTQVRISPVTLPQDNQLEVLAIEPSNITKAIVPKLPPSGFLVKSPPKVESIVYIMKNPVMPWIKAKVCIISTLKYCFSFIFFFHISIRQIKKGYNTGIFVQVQVIVSTNPWSIRVKLLQKKYNAAIKTISGKHLAVAELCQVMIPVGTRVVAIFHDITSSNYYSGIIAEPPKSTNKYR